jgi:hypothetical protein
MPNADTTLRDHTKNGIPAKNGLGVDGHRYKSLTMPGINVLYSLLRATSSAAQNVLHRIFKTIPSAEKMQAQPATPQPLISVIGATGTGKSQVIYFAYLLVSLKLLIGFSSLWNLLSPSMGK